MKTYTSLEAFAKDHAHIFSFRREDPNYAKNDWLVQDWRLSLEFRMKEYLEIGYYPMQLAWGRRENIGWIRGFVNSPSSPSEELDDLRRALSPIEPCIIKHQGRWYKWNCLEPHVEFDNRVQNLSEQLGLDDFHLITFEHGVWPLNSFMYLHYNSDGHMSLQIELHKSATNPEDLASCLKELRRGKDLLELLTRIEASRK